jgi:hypothetical protein
MNVREKEDAEAKAREIAFGPVNLMEMLTSTFLTLLADVGCTPEREDDRFVSHHSIHTRRCGILFDNGCVCVCACVCVCVCACVRVCVHMNLFKRISLMSIYLYACSSIFLSICLPCSSFLN